MQHRVLHLFACACLGLFSVGAHAERYIVKFRTPEATRFTHRLQQMGGDSRFLDTSAQTLATMPNLDMALVHTTSVDEVEQLKQHPDVDYIERDVIFALPIQPLAAPSAAVRSEEGKETPWGIYAVHAPEAWQAASSGSQGEGVRVMVLDSGLDKDHADLRGRFEAGRNFVVRSPWEEFIGFGSLISLANVKCGVRGCDVPRQRALLSDFFANDEEQPLESPPTYDYFDQNGHGTHVSGTILADASERIVGVAPKARLLMGRVCGKFGCANSSIVNGLDWAVAQKPDVVNMSLGGPMPSASIRDACNRAIAAGVTVVAASGNSGEAKIGFPAAYPGVIAVGAVDNSIKRASFSQYGPELALVAPGVDVRSSIPIGSGRESRVAVGEAGNLLNVPSTGFVGSAEVNTPMTAELLFAGLGKTTDFAGRSFAGKIALIQRGELTFVDKVKNALAAGAAGVAIYNNAPGLISGGVTTDGSVLAIPVVMIEQMTGETLKTKLSAGQSMSIRVQTVPTNYASFQGTSMASPHVAGVAALVKGVRKSLTPAQVRTILTSTTTPIEPVSEHGAGMVNAEAAVRAALSFQ